MPLNGHIASLVAVSLFDDERVQDMTDTIQTARDWHSGQTSALYQYLRFGIEGIEHRDECVAEIEVCLDMARNEPEKFDQDAEADLIDLMNEVENPGTGRSRGS